MHRAILLAVVFLAIASPAWAQFTQVTGTVTDPNGLAYAYGTISATLIPGSGASPTLNGASFQGVRSPVGLDANGKFSMQLPDNNVISPSGSQWQFTVNIAPGILPPAGNGPQTFTVTITITGTSQNISANLNASAPILSRSGGSGSGINFGTGGGTAQAQTLTTTNCPTLAGGILIGWVPAANNTAAVPTMNWCSTGAKNIVSVWNEVALIANDIATTTPAFAMYDAVNSVWVLQNPQAQANPQTVLKLGSTPPACVVATAGFWCPTEGTAPTNAAGAAAIYPDSTAHELMVATNGASTATPGMLERVQPSPVVKTAQTALISTATLCASAAGACNTAGQYHVHWDFWGSGTACSSVTAGSVTFLLTWTDENAIVHAAVALEMQAQTGAATEAVQASFPFQTALANESASGDFTISTNGSVIQYATGYTACTTGTGTYNLRASVTRLQ